MQYMVAKFGGTSLADFKAMSRCADIVLSCPHTKLVVVSASSGVTNLLVSLSQHGLTAQQRNQAVTAIRAIQTEITQHLSLSVADCERIDRLLDHVASLSDKLSQLCSLNIERLPLVDELLSCGEQLSSLIFTQVLRERGAQAVLFDARNVIRTSSDFSQGIACVDTIKQQANTRLMPLFEHNIVVTQGFIGADRHGFTTTLGRGGSDYSAALFGEAINCMQINIWTDVTGIFTTDPRITTQAYTLNEISFNEAAEMATFGAKVLHPSTLLPAMRQNIPVFVGSSREPHAGGTIVRNETATKPVYRAIALRRDQTLVTVTSMDMLHASGFLAKVFTLLAKYNVSVDLVTTSEVSVAITLDNTASACGPNQLSDELIAQLEQICQVTIERDLALVALIGNAIDTNRGVGTQLFATLSDTNIRMICQGASSHNLCFLVDDSQATSVINRLHQSLFEASPKELSHEKSYS